MTDLIKQWLIYKELLGLAKLESFSAVRPERVAKVLNYYAHARSSSLDSDGQVFLHTPRLLRSESAMNALMSIWELARAQSEEDDIHRFRWNAIMANCNSIYNGSYSAKAYKSNVALGAKFASPKACDTHVYAADLCQNL